VLGPALPMLEGLLLFIARGSRGDYQDDRVWMSVMGEVEAA
jgi:hypothetical protein